MGPNALVIKATSEETGGPLLPLRDDRRARVPRPAAARPRRARVDMFYVLEGTLTVRLGDEEARSRSRHVRLRFLPAPCTPSPTAATPRFGSSTSTPRAGFEQYMRDLAEASAAGVPPTPEEIGRIASRYDFRAV